MFEKSFLFTILPAPSNQNLIKSATHLSPKFKANLFATEANYNSIWFVIFLLESLSLVIFHTQTGTIEINYSCKNFYYITKGWDAVAMEVIQSKGHKSSLEQEITAAAIKLSNSFYYNFICRKNTRWGLVLNKTAQLNSTNFPLHDDKHRIVTEISEAVVS